MFDLKEKGKGEMKKRLSKNMRLYKELPHIIP